jgi:heme exporter protein B
MTTLSFLLFCLFLGSPIQKLLPFIGVAFLGSWGLSLVFTFLAAIAAKAQQNAAIMAILGFPLIIPQLLMLMKVSNSMFTNASSAVGSTILLLTIMNLLIIILAVILYPFLWKD